MIKCRKYLEFQGKNVPKEFENYYFLSVKMKFEN